MKRYHHFFIIAYFGLASIAFGKNYTISGSAGISGVTMSGLPGNPVSGSGGSYSATVTSGWSGTVTPTKTGYTFTPTSRTYTNVTANQTNQNYTATQITYTISGSTGLDGVTMSGLPGNPVTSGGGSYSATVTYGWSGTVTPTKTGYTFTPATRTYSNVTANQSSQNYTATQITYTISGSTGLDGVTMSGLPGNPVTSGGGSYTATVTYGWSGTVTPTKTGYTFTPTSSTYSNVTANQSSQNYTATQITYTISGSTGLDGVTMSGLPGNPVTSGGGSYSATVTYGWSGTVTPTMTGYTFTPTSRTYTNVTANQTNQNYTATQITYTISGSTGLDGVTMSGLPGNPVTSGGGLYSATVTYGWSGTVTPTKTGYAFVPANKVYTSVMANQASQDYITTQTALTYYVATTGNDNNNGTAQTPFRTMQKGLNSSSNGYTVIVAQGHYYEQINFNGKKVRVCSTDPTNSNVVAATIIDSNNANYDVVTFNTGEDSNSILDGFTIKRGRYGIYCANYASPKIRNCNVQNNSSNGIYCYQGSPDISMCRIMNNSYGVCGWDTITLTNCVIAKNPNGGITTQTYSSGQFIIRNCTIVGNRNSYNTSGSGISGWPDEVKNCIIWDNYDDLNIHNCTPTYCCISNNDSGTDIIHTYPAFVNADANDFHLQIGSQCIDAGDPCSVYNLEPNGGDGRIDMGAYGNTSGATTRGSCHHGMPDSWIHQYWPGADLNTFDPNADPDHDGLRNKDEYNLGWDPMVSNSSTIKGFAANQRTGYRYPSLQMAIDFADKGDVVVAEPNHFYEKIDFKSKRIHLRSSDPNNPSVVVATIIDANDTSTYTSVGVTFQQGEDANSILDGFTIKRGFYGIYCANNSSPKIMNCTIRNNSFAGVYCYYLGAADIYNCRIMNNQVWGVEAWDELTLRNSLIVKNSYGGVVTQTWSDKLVTIRNCTIVSNRTGSSGSGLYGMFDEVKNCIIWDNGHDLLACGNCPAISTVMFSCIEDSDSGTGIIHSNPMFVNADANDYHLWYTSPCIDAGDPNLDYSQEPDYPHGQIDMGAYGNTSEATSNEDRVGDGIPDAWKRRYWPNDDPNLHSPNDNPAGDGFTNLIKYEFKYDPTQYITDSMRVLPTSYSSQIDPTQGQSAGIEYWINKAASEVKIDFSGTTGNIVREIIQTGVTAGKHTIAWNGTDANGIIVAQDFYDVKMTAKAQSNPNDTVMWMSNNVGITAETMSSEQGDSTSFNAYANIPVEISYTTTNWLRSSLEIKTSYPYGETLRTMFTSKLLHPGQNTFYWDGWKNNGQIYEGNFVICHFYGIGLHTGAIIVYYPDPLTNLKCNPYRIIPTYDEITTITYNLACAANVTIDITDPDGQYFTTLLNNVHQNAGSQQVRWYGKNGDPNNTGSRYPSKEGVYTITVRTADPVCTLKGAITVFK